MPPKKEGAPEQELFPVLFAKTKTGSVKWYEIEVHHFKDHSEVRRTYAAKIGGKAQTDTKTIDEGVNIGKSNETTIQQQAENVARSYYNAKRDDGYKTKEELGLTINEDGTYKFAEEIKHNTDASGNIKPMLAEGFDERLIRFPCYAQPKFNGLRSVTHYHHTEGIQIKSRSGKPYYIDRVESEVIKILEPGQYLDGELYHHGMKLNEINSAVKRQSEKHPDQDKIVLVVFDIPMEGTFKERLAYMQKQMLPVFEGDYAAPVQMCMTLECDNMEMLRKAHQMFVNDGHEGTIIRNADGVYEYGARSRNLIKMKDFIDQEFYIVGFEEADGRDAGSIVFTCVKDDAAFKAWKKNPELLEDKKWFLKHAFGCRPEGTLAERKKMFKQGKSYIGKQLNVRFQEWTKENKPMFPVGVYVREAE